MFRTGLMRLLAMLETQSRREIVVWETPPDGCPALEPGKEVSDEEVDERIRCWHCVPCGRYCCDGQNRGRGSERLRG